MRVTINGQAKEIAGPADLAHLAAQFSANTKYIITEINGRIVSCDDRAGTPVKDGDTVELVSFVGGG